MTMTTPAPAPRGAAAKKTDDKQDEVRMGLLSGVGFNTGIRDMIFYLNKNEVVFAIGKHAVLQNIHSQKMAFFELAAKQQHAPGKESRMGDICAMAVTPKRDYLAIARSVHSTTARTESTIAIYCIKTKSAPSDLDAPEQSGSDAQRTRMDPVRTLSYQTHSFSSLAFSHDGKFIAGQTTTADWTFVLWDWHRTRKVATADAHTKVTRICFNPVDVAQISTSGGVHLRLWRLSEPICRPFATFNSANSAVRFVDHTWVGKSDGMVAILDNGDVQYFSNGELVRTIPSLHHGHMLLAVQAFKTSVVVGGERGWISVLEIDSFHAADMHMTRRFRIDSKEAVLGLSMDTSGAGFMCALGSTYAAYDLSNLCLLRDDDELVTLLTYSPLPRLAAISALCTASRKHLVAVAGKRSNGANVISIYNQHDTNGILQHPFVHMVPVCIDMHPCGFEVAVSFSAQVHIYHVLHDVLKLAFEVDIKHASLVKYSPGGNYLAVLVDDKAIYVYRTFGTSEPALTSVCAGREANITTLRWGPDDMRMYAADEYGGFVAWCIDDRGAFIPTQSTKSGKNGLLDRPVAFTSIASTRNVASGHIMVAAAYTTDTDTSGIQIWHHGKLMDEPLQSTPVETKLTALEFGGACVLCAGTSDGSILIYSWSAAAGGTNVLSIDPWTVDLSASAIVALSCCANERLLMAACVDGSLFAAALDVQALPPRFAGDEVAAANLNAVYSTPASQFSCALTTDELSLVDRGSVAEKLLRITDLETEKDQLKMEKEIQIKLNADQVHLLERERANEVRVVKATLEAKMKALEDDMQAKVHEAHTTVLALKKDHEKTLQTMQSIYTTKLSSMNDVCRQLERQVVAERHRVDDAVFSGEEQQMSQRQQLEDAHAKQVQAFEEKIRQLEAQLALKQKQYDEVLSQQNDDQLIHLGAMQATVERVKADHAHQVDSSKETISSLQQQLRMMLNALATKDERIDTVQAEVAQLHRNVDVLEQELANEKKKSAKATSDCVALEAQVAEQLKKIEGLDELNNVRLCKIKTMKQAIAAKEQETHDMRAFIEELHAENSAVIDDANTLDETQAEMKRKMRFYERTMADQKRQVVDLKAIVASFRRDLGIIIEDEQQGNRLKIDAIVKLYHKYDLKPSQSGRPPVLHREMASDEAVIKELTRQHKCAEDHRRKLRTRLDSMTQERQKLVSVLSTDNTKILRDLNAMTRRNRELQQRIVSLEVEKRKKKVLGHSASVPNVHVQNEVEENNNEAEGPEIHTELAQNERIYIPCGVKLNEWPQEKTAEATVARLNRPRSSKSSKQSMFKTTQRPHSAHSTKSESRHAIGDGSKHV